jgi:hypothetical protein
MDDALTEAQRHPLLTDAGRELLRWLHEHPAAPRFNHRCGDRLTADGLARVREFAKEVQAWNFDDEFITPSQRDAPWQETPLQIGIEALAGGSRASARPPEGSIPITSHVRDCFGPHGGPRNDELPAWVMPFAAWCYRDAPFYRGRGRLPADFAAIPTCGRQALSREPWRFVPDSQPLDDLIVYTTSGATTGHSLEVLSHPEVAAMYLPLLEAALSIASCRNPPDCAALPSTRKSAACVTSPAGVRLAGGAERVSIILVCSQRRTYTYATVLSYLAGAGYAKINLDTADWRDPDDRARYLDACDPEVYTGDPLAFVALAELPLMTRPRALISTAMTLLPGLRRQLEARFGCPVLDLYSLNEAGPVAVAVPEAYDNVMLSGITDQDAPRRNSSEASHGDTDSSLDSRRNESVGADPLRMTTAQPFGAGIPASRGTIFTLLQPRLYVEILAADGAACPPGVRGEIALTGGFNPFLPLLRYRTGDFAALGYRDGRRVLVGLEGRPPVLFRGRDGRPINNVDVSTALRPFALAQFQLHQAENGDLTLRVRGDLTPPSLPLPRGEGAGGWVALRAALLSLFGADQPLTIERVEAFDEPGDKVVAFTSALEADFDSSSS